MKAKVTAFRLIALLGPSTAWELMREFGGHHVPQLSDELRRRNKRDLAIQADLDAGYTYEETAARNRVSRPTVMRASQRGVHRSDI